MGKIRNLLLIALVGILSFLGGCGDVDAPKKPDTTAPSVLSLTPPQGATNVAVTSDMYATFSEPVSFSGVSLSFSGGNLPVVAEQPSQETIYLKLSPSRRLDYNTTYTASLSGVKDSSGNSLGTVSWSFTTASPSFNTFTTPDSHNYDAGKYNSIATYGGKRYIVYQATSDCSLRIISTVDGSSFDGPYNIENVSSNECFDKDAAMTIDSSGTIHVVYLHRNQVQLEVKYAYTSISNISNGWQKEVLYQFSNIVDAQIFADITTDNTKKVHISFYDYENTALRYITNKNGLWQTVIVDDGETNDNPGMYTSIKVDNSGYVHISYYDYHSSIGNGNLKYVKGYIDASGNWKNVEGTPLTLDSTGDVGRYTSLTLYNDTPYITYYDGTNKKIKLMTKNASGDWEAQQIVSLSNESYLPLAIEESNGIMHLSYIENGNLYYLSKSLNWSTPVVVDTGIGNGVYSSIVVDSDGKVYISYYDATDKDLKYAHQKN